MSSEKIITLAKDFAVGKITWGEVKLKTSLTNYGELLQKIGELGLTYPILKQEAMSETIKDNYTLFEETLKKSLLDKQVKNNLIILNPSPLITLFRGKGLDALLDINYPILIPDMLFYTFTSDIAKPHAAEVIKWAKENSEKINILPTNTFNEFLFYTKNHSEEKVRERTEIAGLEVLQDIIPRLKGYCFLLFEDSDIEKVKGLIDHEKKVNLISTSGLLTSLERAGFDISTTKILKRALSIRRKC